MSDESLTHGPGEHDAVGFVAGVSARARGHEDRGGDPLDGLVNLFDLGIVLAVAFLLAALSSIDLTPDVLKNRGTQSMRVPKDSVIVSAGERVDEIELKPGETVTGRGEKLGEVYRLGDGRTVIVKPSGATGATAATR
ncbi:MAG: DUF2149 domain-containing protein [Actinobacteria bacterium]|nr:DUF2149 domain-containing protein [Actinomycetota bacterium]